MSRKLNASKRIRAAWIAGVCGIAAAIIGGVLAYELPRLSAASSAAPVTPSTPIAGVDLKMEEVQIELERRIDASDQSSGGPASHDTATASAVDITLRNSSNAPALIVEAFFPLRGLLKLMPVPAVQAPLR
jgi:hypothetical protein